MRLSIRSTLIWSGIVLVALVVAACGGGGEEKGGGAAGAPEEQGGQQSPSAINAVSGAKGKTITVGSKNFTEQFVLGEIYAQALEAAGFTVKKQLNLGSEQIAYKAVKEGQIDGYPEYTGTALTSFFGLKTDEVPKDAKAAYEQAKAEYAKEGITAMAPTPFENSYRIGLTKEKAAELGNPKKISDLKDQAANLSISGYPECRQRLDCLLGVERTYGVKFGKFVASQSPYEVLENGDADTAFVFTTDANLATGKYVALDDDKKLFPPYNISFGMRDDKLKELGPDAQRIIEQVGKPLTVEVMQELNSRVDLDKQKPEKVAGDYLREAGFVQ